MEIIKVDQLSAAARAGALDASLAYNAMFLQHRELIAQTALSGLRGLREIMSETGIYGTAMRGLQEAAGKIEAATVEAGKDPFQAGSSSQQSRHVQAGINGLRNQSVSYQNNAIGSQNTANAAVNQTNASNPERGIANLNQTAANQLRTATDYLVAYGDVSTARSQLQSAVSNAQSAKGQAETLKTQLQAIKPTVPQDRVNACDAIINAANSVIGNASNTLNFINSAPLAVIRSYTPTTHDLGDGYSLATWGSSGYWSITDANGNGILGRPDGTVDNLNGYGSGWKFNTTSTLVLGNDTKITINPGSPANMLISRGAHAFTIDNIRSGATPGVSSYTDLNGRDADRASNDGHIIRMDGNAATWRNNGLLLGDEGGRETIATSAITNELRLDSTDIAISSELLSFINQMGLTDYDYDGDGRLNDVELASVATHAASFIRAIQDAYEQALRKLAQANDALGDLNSMIELLRKQNDRNLDNHSTDAAATKDQLQAIERRLVEALKGLQGEKAPATGNIEGSADKVLKQLTSFAQEGTLNPQPPVSIASPPSGTSDSSPPSIPTPASGSAQTPPTTSVDPLVSSLRRADRLLSGLLGGGSLKILDLPVPSEAGNAPPPVSGTEEVSSNPLAASITQATGGSEPSVSDRLTNLLTQLQAIVSPQEALDPSATQNTTAGLTVVLTLLDQLGLLAAPVPPSGVASPSTAEAGSSTAGVGLAGAIETPTAQPASLDLGVAIQTQSTGTAQETAAMPEPELLQSFFAGLEQLGAALEAAGLALPPASSSSGELPATAALPVLAPQGENTEVVAPPPPSLLAQQLAEFLAGKLTSIPPSLAPVMAEVLKTLTPTPPPRSDTNPPDTGTPPASFEPEKASLSVEASLLLAAVRNLAELSASPASQESNIALATPAQPQGESPGGSNPVLPRTTDLRAGLQSLLKALSEPQVLPVSSQPVHVATGLQALVAVLTELEAARQTPSDQPVPSASTFAPPVQPAASSSVQQFPIQPQIPAGASTAAAPPINIQAPSSAPPPDPAALLAFLRVLAELGALTQPANPPQSPPAPGSEETLPQTRTTTAAASPSSDTAAPKPVIAFSFGAPTAESVSALFSPAATAPSTSPALQAQAQTQLPSPVQQLLEFLTGLPPAASAALPPEIAPVLSQIANVIQNSGPAQPPAQAAAPASSPSVQALPAAITTEKLLRALQALALLQPPPPATPLPEPRTTPTAATAPASASSPASDSSSSTPPAAQEASSSPPTVEELRLGLLSFLNALAAFGAAASTSTPDNSSPQTPQVITASTSNTSANLPGFTGNTQLISSISSNFYTDPALMRIIEENLRTALQTQQSQLARAGTLFVQSQEIVQKFVTLIKEDDLVHEVVKSDDLSDEKQALFDDRMTELRKDLGVEWGGDADARTPAAQTNLVTRAVQSGLMV